MDQSYFIGIGSPIIGDNNEMNVIDIKKKKIVIYMFTKNTVMNSACNNNNSMYIYIMCLCHSNYL